MKNLITALIKFQKAVPAIPKNKVNPFYGSKYAELSTCIDTCTPVLTANGLAVIQLVKVDGARNVLTTMVCHESGEFLESSIYLPEIADPQKLTASVTYLRRSTYLAAIGLVAEDDEDGNSLVSQPKPQVKAPSTPASDAQKALLKKLNISFSPDISKDEASKLIQNNKV
jgi:hypothetical protein